MASKPSGHQIRWATKYGGYGPVTIGRSSPGHREVAPRDERSGGWRPASAPWVSGAALTVEGGIMTGA